jgi:hypothetical protein
MSAYLNQLLFKLKHIVDGFTINDFDAVFIVNCSILIVLINLPPISLPLKALKLLTQWDGRIEGSLRLLRELLIESRSLVGHMQPRQAGAGGGYCGTELFIILKGLKSYGVVFAAVAIYFFP